MPTIAFFNNKGGVGKTTLACNIASYISRVHDKKVALLDLDPQCNSSQYVLGDSVMERLLDDKADRAKRTFLSVTEPLRAGGVPEGFENLRLEPSDENEFGIDILPCHPRISLFEDILGEQWQRVRLGVTGPIRVSNWFYSLTKELNKRYDYVIVDLGPSLGALNRSVLLGSEYMVTPMGCDIYSIAGIVNIADWIGSWLQQYIKGVREESTEFDLLQEADVLTDVGRVCNMLGFTVQQYLTKTIAGERRATKSYQQIRDEIPVRVAESMKDRINPARTGLLSLGDIPHMYSLVPLSQWVHKPIDLLRAKDGLAGGQRQVQDEYQRVMSGLVEGLLRSEAAGE